MMIDIYNTRALRQKQEIRSSRSCSTVPIWATESPASKEKAKKKKKVGSYRFVFLEVLVMNKKHHTIDGES